MRAQIILYSPDKSTQYHLINSINTEFYCSPSIKNHKLYQNTPIQVGTFSFSQTFPTFNSNSSKNSVKNNFAFKKTAITFTAC